ncbi:MAG: CAP domain-containing protein [Anaerolineales bacterium]|nr:CAP domain-containing protein [Anaerolineales bacterium]
MSIIGKLRHWFTPHASNNFRARLLHNSGILAVIAIILTGNVFLRLLDSTNLHILGFTSSVTIDEVVRATNNERLGAGLKPLAYNEKLADAARRKAANMLSENYWAHNSPSGKSPWVWFNDAGYTYVFAGENLAKDFGDTSRLMSAWMASLTHKENIINPKYSEIGIAVVPGSLQGSDTVLIVQFFGTPSAGSVSSRDEVPSSTPVPMPVQVAQVKGQTVISSEVERSPAPRFNQFNLARTLNLATTMLFILALILDLLIAESQKLSRRVGNNWAHIIFINFILLATTIVNAGKIL